MTVNHTPNHLRARYEAWLRQVRSPAHARRTAERSAAFLLPPLQPGMRLLGAASISVTSTPLRSRSFPLPSKR
jgi:hypothetical protein